MKKPGKSILILILTLMMSLLVAATMVGCGQSSEVDLSHESGEVAENEIENGDDTQDNSVGIEDKDGNDNSAAQATKESGGRSGGGTDGGQENKGDTSSQTQEQNTGKEAQALKCTFSINCGTVFDNLNKIDAAIVEPLPKDGWIYPPKEVEFAEGESVFDILLRVTREEKIHMESNSNPALKSKYVEGIHNLYAGELSGWTYKINGKGMAYGSSSSYPEDGDIIEWVYTCDQGRDVGVEP